jgi:cytochrome c peroxidase
MTRYACLLALAAAVFAAEISKGKLQKYEPLPEAIESPSNALTEAKIRLGRMLYYDPRLSRAQDVSCNTCHLLDRYGVDGKRVSNGDKGQTGDRNAPTVYNAAGHFVQFWDGRAADVEEQAKGPVLNPVEMAMPSAEVVVGRLKAIPGYVKAFAEAFPGEADAVTYDNMGRAIGAFERRLVTPARWDRYLRGEKSALTEEEKKGFGKFTSAGCAECHRGAYVGGEFYKKLGLEKPWPDKSDEGRFRVTKKPSDRMVFKVPSLRNIEKTGPYLHDGRVESLEEAVRVMAEYQSGKRVSPADVNLIVAWLKTLTGDIPAEYIKAPALPAPGGSRQGQGSPQ